MRVLGTKKKSVRAIFTAEQGMLSAAGLIIGAGVLAVYRGAALTSVSGQLLIFAAAYFAVILISGIICSTLATRRSALELLQTKE